MKKTIFFIYFFLSISVLCAQDTNKVLFCKRQACLYSNCATDKLIGQIPFGTRVIRISETCYDNPLELAVIRVKTEREIKLTNDIVWLPSNPGWVYPEYFYSNIDEYISDSSLKRNKYLLDSVATAKWHIADSIDKQVSIRRQQKFDSLQQIWEKIKYSKQLWIEKIIAIPYTDESTGIEATFLNTSKKTIKYINFTVLPYNPVDDPVIDQIGNSYKNCQLIGPIEPDELAIYSKDILFHSGVIKYYKMKNISVQYMDNTIKYFNFSDIIEH